MSSFSAPNAFADPEDPESVAEAKQQLVEPLTYSYTEVTLLVHITICIDLINQRDVILYNLGIGATEKELQWTFEGDDNFSALPTFGVIPQFPASSGLPLDWLPNFNPVRIVITSIRTGDDVFERQSYFTESNISVSEVQFQQKAN